MSSRTLMAIGIAALIGAAIGGAVCGREDRGEAERLERVEESLARIEEALAKADERSQRSEEELARVTQELARVTNELARRRDTRGDAPTHPLRAAECSGEPVEAVYNDLGTAGAGPGCARADVSRWKSGAPGSACERSIDCQPVCCECSAEGRYAATSWCDHGKCATPDQACCALLGTPTLSCGNR